jgi:protein-L-isoaspartate(D-aspartate) O-methyltransferase
MRNSNNFDTHHENMVSSQLIARGISDSRVLDAFRAVPRHRFVPLGQQHLAYKDQPLPIGEDQTISQPYVVALMTQLLRLEGHETVLEIGTGSGYQTAILCHLVQHVYSLEYRARLAGRAARLLEEMSYNNIDIHVGDGSQGLADMAPFDAILVTAAAPALPGPLRSQLNPDGGRMILPVGDKDGQHLEVVTRYGNTWEITQMERVKFVPLLGRYGFKSPSSTYSRNGDDWVANF